jgi:hypothetical protein
MQEGCRLGYQSGGAARDEGCEQATILPPPFQLARCLTHRNLRKPERTRAGDFSTQAWRRGDAVEVLRQPSRRQCPHVTLSCVRCMMHPCSALPCGTHPRCRMQHAVRAGCRRQATGTYEARQQRVLRRGRRRHDVEPVVVVVQPQPVAIPRLRLAVRQRCAPGPAAQQCRELAGLGRLGGRWWGHRGRAVTPPPTQHQHNPTLSPEAPLSIRSLQPKPKSTLGEREWTWRTHTGGGKAPCKQPPNATK